MLLCGGLGHFFFIKTRFKMEKTLKSNKVSNIVAYQDLTKYSSVVTHSSNFYISCMISANECRQLL